MDHLVLLEAFDGDADVVHSKLELLNGRRCDVDCRQYGTVLASSPGPQVFFDRACPFSSGVVAFNDEFAGWFVFANGPCDYVLGEAHALHGERRVAASSLDVLVMERRCESPSMLIIDAQGATSQILDGARQALSESIDAVVCEVELAPVYGGQISFSAVLERLWSAGFVFAGFTPEEVCWASPVRLPVGQRSDPLPVAQDARFIRLPDRVSPLWAASRLAKYAVVACVMGLPEFAIAALKRLPPNAFQERLPDVAPALREFCRGLDAAARAMPDVFPPSFARFVAEPVPAGVATRELCHGFDLSSPEPTILERHFEAYGFGSVAQVLRRNRVSQGRYVR